jgi:hypothetical protein
VVNKKTKKSQRSKVKLESPLELLRMRRKEMTITQRMKTRSYDRTDLSGRRKFERGLFRNFFLLTFSDTTMRY